ncbi:MAG: sugar ABC transporter ATP-binding protein [Thermogutta sp.]
MPEAILACHAITKRFGGILALDHVDFELFLGEVHGLVGSNGAGKSTLMKILAGAIPDYEGTVVFNGQSVALRDPHTAIRLGIAMVYQEFSGIGQLSVAENLFLGRQPLNKWGFVDWQAMNKCAETYLNELGIRLDVSRRLDRYPLVVRQMVEIAKGAYRGAKVLILDEPTSALSPPEIQRLFELIRQFKSRGVAMIFISHFLEDVLKISDRVTVLREGRHVLTASCREITKQELVRAMVGERSEEVAMAEQQTAILPPRTRETPIFVTEDLTIPGVFEGINLEVAPSEILGLYGFVGAGHQELVQSMAGVNVPARGRLLFKGEPLPTGRPRAAVKKGIVLVTADRAAGLFMRGEVYKNATMAHLKQVAGEWITTRREIGAVLPVLNSVRCRPADPWLKASQLSGGNQQKVVFAKWLLGPIQVLLLEEPTRGMDIAAKEEVMRLVQDLATRGVAVILASTEPELILRYAHRIVVLSRGRITASWAGTTITKQDLMRAA